MHPLYVLWYGYFWPSLKGNGPEAIVQTIVYAVIAYLFIPPFRRWMHEENVTLHAKLDHIIHHHPEIPEFVNEDDDATR
jgi:hypothetical protein